MATLKESAQSILNEKQEKIIPENIKEGIIIFGIEGALKQLDTSDANALASNILEEKTAYVNGQKVTGTMEDHGIITITPSELDQMIEEGHITKVIVLGDPNLLPENIKLGTTVFGVEGTLNPELKFDTSEATATSNDILSGKTAYIADGTLATGNIRIGGQIYGHKLREWGHNYSQSYISIYPTKGYYDGTTHTAAVYIPRRSNWYQATAEEKRFINELFTELEITPDIIKKGTSLYTISGTFTSDADATSGDIVANKTAYVNGEKITGTLEISEPVSNVEVEASKVAMLADDSNKVTVTALSNIDGLINTNTSIQVKATNDQVATAIGLAPDIIKAGANVLGIEGTYDSNPEDYNAKFQAPEGVTSGLSPLMMLVSIESIDTSKLTSVASLFNGCVSLKSLPEMDLTNASQGAWMCQNCTNLVYTPNLNMPKMQSTAGMFANCSNISYINLVSLGPKYHSYDNMFRGCTNLKEIPNITYNESNSYGSMFRDCKSLTNIDMKGVQTNNHASTQVQYMCYNCTNLKEFSNFTARAYDYRYSCTTEYMFYNCTNLEKVSNLTLRDCTTTNYMFGNCTNLKTLENCSIAFGNRGSGQFENCYNLVNAFEDGNISISAHYYGIMSTFRNCYNLRFNNGFVNASLYVNGCSIGSTFHNCRSIESANLSVASYTGDYSIHDFGEIFYGCTNLKTANVIVANSRKATISGTFRNCTNLTTVNINIPDMSPLNYVFDGCTNLTNLPNCNWLAVNNYYGTFRNCTSLTDLYNLKSVAPCVESMFEGCTNLNNLNNFSASNINLMCNMFRNCTNLKSISNLTLSTYGSIGASRIDNAFVDCTSLTDLQAFEFTTIFKCNNGGASIFGNYNDILNKTISPLWNLVNFGGFINYGIGFNTYARSVNNTYATLDIVGAPNLSTQSLQNIITNVYNLYIAYNVTNGVLNYPQLIRMEINQYNKLTETDISNLQSKGWNIEVHTIS